MQSTPFYKSIPFSVLVCLITLSFANNAACFSTPNAFAIESSKPLNVSDFITVSEASNILQGSCFLKDSTRRETANLTRFVFNYKADSTAKDKNARLFFTYESNKTAEATQAIFLSIKTENEKIGNIQKVDDIAAECYLIKDSLNQPFLIIYKADKIIKIKVYSIASEASLAELIKTAKKIATKL